MTGIEIDGILPIVPTPFLPNGSVDRVAPDRLLEFSVSDLPSGIRQ
jgi:dihydrodipicolinate synthase/N-acetylneuraminate lyase